MNSDLMPDVVIDLETLGLGLRPVILSISALWFHRDIDMSWSPEYTETYGRTWYLNLDDQVHMGRTLNTSTIMWWLQQSEAAREEQIRGDRHPSDGNLKIGIRRALVDFETFIAGADRVWACGPQEDLIWLKTLYEDMGVHKMPWDYSSARCVRTIREHAHVTDEPSWIVPHIGLHDCWLEANLVVEGFRGLRQK